ncbi:MAG: FKBP-type peptidyl-prolyl cis-trans isomerase [Bacteroidales bacterium]|nr:FKBP-type peptidyl-prolyl cis-trans isomerase [Bacteroidales bacterium]
MKTIKIITMCMLGVLILASCGTKKTNPQPEGITKADVDSVSYALGASVGQSISMNNFGDLNMNALTRGIKDALAEKEGLDQEYIYKTVNGFFEKRNNALLKVNIAAGQKFMEENGKKEGVITTESGIQYQIVRTGNGVKPSADDIVEVNYEGTLLNGKVFDSSYKRKESVTFPLNSVIKGWAEGLQYIDEGGEITLWIPSGLAYGEKGAGGVIGPNETLKFKVELIKVKTPAAVDSTVVGK